MAEIPLKHRARRSGRLMALHPVPQSPVCFTCSKKHAGQSARYCESCLRLRARVFLFIGATWRNELTIIRHLGVGQALAEDTLFHLVEDRMLLWFGAEGRLDVPMNYRLTATAREQQRFA